MYKTYGNYVCECVHHKIANTVHNNRKEGEKLWLEIAEKPDHTLIIHTNNHSGKQR